MNLEEALALVAGRADFVVKRADGYVAIDYVFTGEDTFSDPRRTELRGAKFRPDGSMLARPLHKFFNVGERPEVSPDKIIWDAPHSVTEKLDGSMVHPAVLNGQVRLMTRMGITDVAEACAERHLSRVVRAVQAGYDPSCWTPCFEWVSPANRVVLGYPEDDLVLLALRTVRDGAYLPRDLLAAWAKDHGFRVPRVLATDAYGDWAGLARHVQDLEDAEGYVVWFGDGSAVKVKAPWYVTRHRALDGLRFEHHVVRLVLDGGVDDVLPLLSEADRGRLEWFSVRLNRHLAHLGQVLDERVERYRAQGETRRGFAERVLSWETPELRPILFQTYDSGNAGGHLADMVRKACSSGTRLASILEAAAAPRWVP